MNASPRQTSSFSVVRSLGDREELACAAYAEQHGSPMQHPLWLRACMDTISREADVRLVTAGSSGSCAVAPLLFDGHGGRLEMPGVAELYEPADFLYSDPAALPAVAEALASLPNPVFLRRVPAMSPALSALRNAYRKSGFFVCRPVSGYPSIPLSWKWLEPERQLPPGRASDFRRALRIAARMGPVRHEFHSPSPDSLGALLDEAFDLETRSWKRSGGTDLQHDGLRGPFYRACASRASQRGLLRLAFLRIGDRAAAMQIAIECGNRYWLLKSSYDEAFARCSPGLLLLLACIRRAAVHLRSFEFLGTPEGWTKAWTRQVHPCVSVRAYPGYVPGLASLSAEALRVSFRKFGHFVRSLS